MFKLFFAIIYTALFCHTTVVQAQIEGGIGLVSQKFFGSANSNFRFGIAPQVAIGYQNLFYLGFEYQYYFPHSFSINEPIKETASGKIVEIATDAHVHIQSYSFWIKYIWAQPTPKKRNQFYLQSGAVYMQYPYRLSNRQNFDSNRYTLIQPNSDVLTAWMLEAGIGYEWLVGKWAGAYLEVRGRYPLSRRSEGYEEIDINSALLIQAGMRFRYSKMK
jgi:hypothetical protein